MLKVLSILLPILVLASATLVACECEIKSKPSDLTDSSLSYAKITCSEDSSWFPAAISAFFSSTSTPPKPTLPPSVIYASKECKYRDVIQYVKQHNPTLFPENDLSSGRFFKSPNFKLDADIPTAKNGKALELIYENADIKDHKYKIVLVFKNGTSKDLMGEDRLNFTKEVTSLRTLIDENFPCFVPSFSNNINHIERIQPDILDDKELLLTLNKPVYLIANVGAKPQDEVVCRVSTQDKSNADCFVCSKQDLKEDVSTWKAAGYFSLEKISEEANKVESFKKSPFGLRLIPQTFYPRHYNSLTHPEKIESDETGVVVNVEGKASGPSTSQHIFVFKSETTLYDVHRYLWHRRGVGIKSEELRKPENTRKALKDLHNTDSKIDISCFRVTRDDNPDVVLICNSVDRTLKHVELKWDPKGSITEQLKAVPGLEGKDGKFFYYLWSEPVKQTVKQLNPETTYESLSSSEGVYLKMFDYMDMGETKADKIHYKVKFDIKDYKDSQVVSTELVGTKSVAEEKIIDILPKVNEVGDTKYEIKYTCEDKFLKDVETKTDEAVTGIPVYTVEAKQIPRVLVKVNNGTGSNSMEYHEDIKAVEAKFPRASYDYEPSGGLQYIDNTSVAPVTVTPKPKKPDTKTLGNELKIEFTGDLAGKFDFVKGQDLAVYLKDKLKDGDTVSFEPKKVDEASFKSGKKKPKLPSR